MHFMQLYQYKYCVQYLFLFKIKREIEINEIEDNFHDRLELGIGNI